MSPYKMDITCEKVPILKVSLAQAQGNVSEKACTYLFCHLGQQYIDAEDVIQKNQT
jgi:hypothetical protein